MEVTVFIGLLLTKKGVEEEEEEEKGSWSRRFLIEVRKDLHERKKKKRKNWV